MKGFALTLLAVVAGLLVGCTDQSSIVDPATPQASVSVPAPPPESRGSWNLDKLVYVKETGQTFHIYGDIFWTMADNNGEYIFSTDVKAEVSLVTEEGGSETVSGAVVNKGDVSKSGITMVVNEFPISSLQSGSSLALTYQIGERARLADVSIIFRPWDSRKAQLGQ